MNEKQRKILEDNFRIYDDEYADKKALELETWTNGGVDMIIYVDLIDNKNIIEELEEYVKNFDIDYEIDMYRQDKRYRDAFKITESVKDFEEWIEFVKNIIEKLKECN